MYRSHRDPVKPGTGQMTGTGTQYPVSGARSHRPHRVYRVHRPHRVHQSHRVQRSHRVHWSDQSTLVRNKRKRPTSAWTGLSFLFLFHRSPVRLVQLEHNVHEPLGNMPTLQIEHSSEHSQAFQDLNSDSRVPVNIGCTGYTGSDQAQLVTPGDPSLGMLLQIDPLGLGPILPGPTLGIWLVSMGLRLRSIGYAV